MRKIGKYLLAFLPFLMTVAIFFLVQNVIYTLILLLFSAASKGSGAPAAAYDFYMTHQNTISCLMYAAAMVPALFWYCHKFFKKDSSLKKNRYLYRSSYGYAILMAFGMSHAISLLFFVISIAMPQAMNNYTNLIESSGVARYSVTWFLSTILLAPFVEELVFRGLTMRLFRRAGAPFLAANLLQAALFGCYHMNLVQGLYAFLIGLSLGYLANHYRTLTVGMACHAFFNLMGTVGSSIESLYFNTGLQITMMFAGLLLVIFAILLVHQQKPRKRQALTMLQNPYEELDSPFI